MMRDAVVSGHALDHALAYIALGWHVLPIAPASKVPLNGQGLHHATLDEQTIRRWWTEHPEAGIGLALEASGLCAVDIDPRNGGDLDLRDMLPATLTAATGGGGLHLVYRVPAGVRLKAGIGPGVDVKHKGYIVVEPSLHASGRRYSWIDFESLEGEVPQIAEVPAELVAGLDERRAAAPVSGTGAAPLLAGGRNVGLASVAGSMRRAGLSAEAVEAALLSATGVIRPLRSRRNPAT